MYTYKCTRVHHDPLEAVLGGQLLVLGPESVHPVNHLLDELHLGVAQAMLVGDVVGDTCPQKNIY